MSPSDFPGVRLTVSGQQGGRREGQLSRFGAPPSRDSTAGGRAARRWLRAEHLSLEPIGIGRLEGFQTAAVGDRSGRRSVHEHHASHIGATDEELIKVQALATGWLDRPSPKWDIGWVRRILAANEKPLHWVGSSKRDFLAFPEAVRNDMGNALGIVQFGGTPPGGKPWKGLGPGVLELVESHDGNAYRAVYTVRFADAAYVLHAFQKKSPSGVRTAQKDADLVEQRLRAAQRDYEEHHGKAKH